MKTRITICTLALLLFNSCIVKSLFPFFTKETIHYEKALIGNWIDKENGEWKIMSFEEKFKKDIEEDNFTKEESKLFKDYLKGYHIERNYKNIKSFYLAVPFKLNNQLFIDFIPSLENEFESVPELVSLHHVKTHSLVKVDFKNNTMNLKWLDSEKLKKLLVEKRIKIKHVETLDLPNKYLLTASSEELQEFVKKYMNSNDDNKWVTDIKFNLKRINEKP